MHFDRSVEVRKRAHVLIPGGVQTYAKGDDEYVEFASGFVERRQGRTSETSTATSHRPWRRALKRAAARQ